MYANDEIQDKTGQSNNVVIDNLGAVLQGQFEEWKSARQIKEEEWLDALQAFHSEYSVEEAMRLQQNGEHKSKIYIGLTRMKVVAAYARIVDLLFQPGQRIGEVQPTPIPDTEEMTGAQFKAQVEIEQLVQQGLLDVNLVDVEQLTMQRVKELRDEAVVDAEKRCNKMNNVIEDQMAECNAERKLKLAISEMVILGDGCIKGVTVNIRGQRKWARGEDGQFTLQYVDQVYPDIEFRSIFNIYPDPYATGSDDMTGLFDRHIMTKQDFIKLGQLDGFDEEIIRKILIDSPAGNYVEEHHESRRREMGGINANSGSQNRFEVLEYWGAVSGKHLLEAGVEVDDEHAEYQANVWMCNGLVIKAMLNPLMPQNIPYLITPYEFNVHSFWGTGLPKMMRDSQAVINVSARITLDNMAISSGPICEVNTDLLPPGANVKDIKPWSVHARSGGDSAQPLMRFYQHPNLSQPAMQLIEMFRRFADEETSMPSYSHGQTSNSMTKTASGMSMLMGAANVSLKSVIKNIDDYLIEPLLTSFYDWNMRWNEDEGVKGDALAVARGSSALMAREVRSERLMQFANLSLASPVLAELVKADDLLREVAASMDLNPDEILLSEEEIEAKRNAMQAAAQLDQSQQLAGNGEAPNGQPAPQA